MAGPEIDYWDQSKDSMDCLTATASDSMYLYSNTLGNDNANDNDNANAVTHSLFDIQAVGDLVKDLRTRFPGMFETLDPLDLLTVKITSLGARATYKNDSATRSREKYINFITEYESELRVSFRFVSALLPQFESVSDWSRFCYTKCLFPRV
jgi:hypothetical protein